MGCQPGLNPVSVLVNLHPESIAAENPQFTPELVHPTVVGSIVNPADWAIPELNGMPVFIQTASGQAAHTSTEKETCRPY
jgi:hypothetical protein